MRNNKTQEYVVFRKMIDGINKHLGSVTTIPLQGVATAPKAIAQLLQELIDASDATAAATVKSHDAHKAERDKLVAAGPILRAFRSYLLVAFGDAADLADFGLVPRKPRAKVPPDKGVTAAKKRRATRAARHTMGKRQKQAIKGNVPDPGNGSAGVNGGGPAVAPGGTTPPKP